MGVIYHWDGFNSQSNTAMGAIKKILEKLFKLRSAGVFSRVRLLMKMSKTVSSLSVYESAYTYCPLKSIIVSSRHNVELLPTFATTLWRSLTTKQHYFYVPFRYSDASGVVSLERTPKWGKPYSFRENSTLY